MVIVSTGNRSWFFLGSKLFFSLNFSLFWRYFGKKFWKLAYFSLKNGKLIFIKIFNVFQGILAKSLENLTIFGQFFKKISKESPIFFKIFKVSRFGTEMKKEVFANYAENCSKLKILKFLTLKMPEFVTCKFVKRLKTNRIWRKKKKKFEKFGFRKN